MAEETFSGEKWVMASRRVWAGISATVAVVLVALKGFGVELPFGITEVNAFVVPFLGTGSVILVVLSKVFPDNAILRRVMRAGFTTAPKLMILLACFFWLGCSKPPPCAPCDSDRDGIADTLDNCTFDANVGQEDPDADGFGTVCDADFNQDLAVSGIDSGMLESKFNAPFDPVYDLDGDGKVARKHDSDRFEVLFARGAPGPSAGK